MPVDRQEKVGAQVREKSTESDSSDEQTFQSERQAWVSTSMSNKMLMAESSSTRVEATDFSGNNGGN